MPFRHGFFPKGTVQLREMLYKIIKFMQTLDATAGKKYRNHSLL